MKVTVIPPQKGFMEYKGKKKGETQKQYEERKKGLKKWKEPRKIKLKHTTQENLNEFVKMALSKY